MNAVAYTMIFPLVQGVRLYDCLTRETHHVPVLAQATTALSDGRIFVIGGSWTGGLGGKNGEVYTNGANWRLLPG